MKVSAAGLKHIAEFEGTSLKLYDDPAGNCTIGTGRLVHVGRCDGRISETPYKSDITLTQARLMLAEDVVRYEACVEQAVKVPIKRNQFDALVSLAYNIGCAGFQGSTVLTVLNRGQYGKVCAELRKYVRGNDGQTYPGLVRRREAECALFSSGENVSLGTEEDMTAFVGVPAANGIIAVVWITGGLYRRKVGTARERTELAKALGISEVVKPVSKATLDALKLTE